MPYVICMLLLSLSLATAQKPSFAVAGATIEYKVKSPTINGVRLVYFDYAKKLMRIETNYTVQGKSDTESDVFIFRNDSIYQLDMGMQTYMNVTKSQEGELFPWVESQMVFAQGNNLGNEVIKDLQTQVWIASADKYWIYKGLILKKSVTENAGRNTFDLSYIDLNVPNSEYFIIPKSFSEEEDPMSSFLDDIFGDD